MRRAIFVIKRLTFPLLLSLSLIWFISGCVRYIVNVDSIKAPSKPTGVSCYLLSGMDGVSSNDLQFNGQTGGGTSTFSAIGPGGLTTGTIYTQPRYGVVGTGVGSVTTYFRFIILEATDFDEYKTTGRIVPLWKTNITSTGTSGDLRRVFPILVGAAADYIGTDTTKQVSIILTEDDDRVKYIKEMKYKEQPDKGISIQKEIYKDTGTEKKKTSIYSFEEIKGWHNAVKDREWRKISESEDITHCYDTRNISYPSKDIVRVYTLATFESKKAINDKINHYRQVGLSAKGYENLYGTVTLQEINCNNKMYLPIFFMDYDKNRNPLNQSYDLSSNGWSEISSTMPTLEKLYKVVWKYSSATFLFNAGIPTKIDAQHAIAHNKVMVIDGAIVIAGSSNFTKAAEENNAENLLIIHDKKLALLCTRNWQNHHLWDLF